MAMSKKMYTYKVRVNNSEPLHKTVVVHADSDKAAEALAIAKIPSNLAACLRES